MNNKELKDETIKIVREYWEKAIGRDFDQGDSIPEWVQIRKIVQAIREYDHDPDTCEHDFEEVMWGEEKGLIVCMKCGMPMNLEE